MPKGYKIYLAFVLTAFSVLGAIAWKLGILDLLIDTYYVPPSEWNLFYRNETPPTHNNRSRGADQLKTLTH